jgi:tetratricopeptide (TPR) repeat protein
MILLSERSRLDEVLNEGLDRYPESFSLNVYRMVIDSMNPQRADDREWKQLLSYREIGDYAEIVGMAYFNIGRGLADLEDRAGAIEAYRRSLFFRPDHSQVLERLGALLIADGQIEEGLNRLQRAVDLAPYHGGYRYSLALALQFANRTEEAIQACHQGLQIRATSELYYLLGGCLGHLGKKKEAAAVFRRGLQIFSNDRALLLGLAKAEEGHG